VIVGYVPGVFDLLHVGHLRLLERAAAHCDHLVAGVVTDAVAEAVKGRRPVIDEVERQALVASLRMVDEVVPDTSADKRVAWRRRPFDVLFKGDDWRGTPKGDALEAEMAELGVTLVYLPYTRHVASSVLRDRLVAPHG